MNSFFSSWRFPTFAIAVVVGLEMFLFAILLLPTSGEFAEFTEEFRTSCFGYDPATGAVESIVVFTTLAVPLIVVWVVSIIWWRELGEALRTHRIAVAGYVGIGVVAAFAGAAIFAAAGGSSQTGEMPFPAQTLRTSLAAPDFALKDHTGRPVQLANLRGKVVLVTSFFSTCSASCPMILSDVQNAVASLSPEQMKDLRIAVITLDPEHDTPAELANVATARGFASPPFHFLSGEPAAVEKTLDHLAVPRYRDAATGLINHSNLFILIDRQGSIAYRFAPSQRQQTWLESALRELLVEEASGTDTH